MQTFQEFNRFHIINDLFKNKDNVFVAFYKNKLHMKVHIYPYIIEKKIINNETEYSMKLMY